MENYQELKRAQLVCLSNLLVDITIPATDDDIIRLGAKKGDYTSFSKIDADYFNSEVILKKTKICAAGSPGNVAFNLASNNVNTRLLGVVGNDDLGKFYIDSANKERINTAISVQEGKTGVAYALITPDSERTFINDMGVSQNNFQPENLDLVANYIHTSLYELRSPAAMRIINTAHDLGTKISLDLASPKAIDYLVSSQRKELEKAISISDVLFMNEFEAKTLAGYHCGFENPINYLKKLSSDKIIVLKLGKAGSLVIQEGIASRNEAPHIKEGMLKNTNGAGDAFASGFLKSLTDGVPISKCYIEANFVAAKVCCLDESHL
jgi:sugar/nucleoside kinase (ribokinase family)